MGIMTIFKARSAASKLSKGDTEGAMRLYKEAIDEGLQDVRYILTYVVLLIRAGRYQEARGSPIQTARRTAGSTLRAAPSALRGCPAPSRLHAPSPESCRRAGWWTGGVQ